MAHLPLPLRSLSVSPLTFFFLGGQVPLCHASPWRPAKRHLSSFPGWNEEGAFIGQQRRCIGDDAADTCPLHSWWNRLRTLIVFKYFHAAVYVDVFWRNIYYIQYIYTYIQYNIDNICLSLSHTPAEKGQFLALDLGGSKFKVLQVKVREGMGIRRGGVEIEEKTYMIPKELLTGRGTEVGRRGGGTGNVQWKAEEQGKVELLRERRNFMNSSPSASLFSLCLSVAIWPCVRVSKGLPAWEEHQCGEETSSGLHILLPLWTVCLE